MAQRRAGLRAALAVLLAAAAALSASAAAPGGADKGGSDRLTNVVTDWVNATQAIVATAGIQNQLSAKYYGLVGLAAHQAIQAGGAPPAALAAAAGHAIVAGSFPWAQGSQDVLLAKQLSGFTAAEQKKALEVAVPIASKLLKERAGDESTAFAGFKPAPNGTGNGAYEFVPGQKYALYPQLARATPFVLSKAEADAIAFNKDPKKGPVFQPPKDDYQKTFELGSKDSTKRKQYDADSAWFWADGANTSAITGHFLDIAREVLPKNLSVADTALFYARAGQAAYDAGIIGWKVKYSTLHWRPVTVFNQGNWTSANGGKRWEPLLGRTPSHPEYASGHQGSAGAILEVLVRTLGKDKVDFSIGSEGAPWLGKRNYSSLTAAAEEVGDSRLFGGVHFPSANADGLKLGRLVGARVFEAFPGGSSSGSSGTSSGSTAKAGRRLMDV